APERPRQGGLPGGRRSQRRRRRRRRRRSVRRPDAREGESAMAEPKHLVRTGALGRADATHGKHPFNPNSEMYMLRLSEQTGLKRLPVNLLRLPPGKESWIP